MTNRIQFKSFKMESFDADTGIVEGYASTYGNVDKANDVVVPGAFKTALLNGPERVRFLWEHDRKSVIGVITEMSEDDKGLYVKAQFANTQKAQETRDLMKMGAVDSFSIGYRVIQEGPGQLRGKSVNFLKEIQLLEVSCVAWPCNVEARMTAIKSEVEDRFADLNLEQQALVTKFIDFLEAESGGGAVSEKTDDVAIDIENMTEEDHEMFFGEKSDDEATDTLVEEKSEQDELDAKALEELFEAYALVEAMKKSLRD